MQQATYRPEQTLRDKMKNGCFTQNSGLALLHIGFVETEGRYAAPQPLLHLLTRRRTTEVGADVLPLAEAVAMIGNHADDFWSHDV